MYKNYFPINLKKTRLIWKKKGARQDGFAGYTRTMMQTYEDYRVDAPIDLICWVSENTGISIHDLITREVLRDEIPIFPKSDLSNMDKEVMEERKKSRVEGLS